jgi:ribosome maturation factor RimP
MEISERRERSRSLLLLSGMNIELSISTIEQKIQELLTTEPDYFLVDVKINSGNNVKVFIDADQGASIDKLVSYNRKLYKWIDESSLFPGDNFSLEVSSPGLDEPLKLRRQYVKNIGRPVEVTKKDEIKLTGKLVSVEETGITIEEEKARLVRKKRNNEVGQARLTGKDRNNEVGQARPTGKKKEIAQHTITFDSIKTITVQIKF